jgi:hypothetical protein
MGDILPGHVRRRGVALRKRIVPRVVEEHGRSSGDERCGDESAGCVEHHPTVRAVRERR